MAHPTRQLPPGGRHPYVGEGADGCQRSAQIDREEAQTLDRANPRVELLEASAARWELQAAWHRATDPGPDPAITAEPDPLQRARNALLHVHRLAQALDALSPDEQRFAAFDGREAGVATAQAAHVRLATASALLAIAEQLTAIRELLASWGVAAAARIVPPEEQPHPSTFHRDWRDAPPF